MKTEWITTDKRLEKEADAVASKWLEVQYTAAKTSYIAGALSERNKAIDECIETLITLPSDVYHVVRGRLEKLKVEH